MNNLDDDYRDCSCRRPVLTGQLASGVCGGGAAGRPDDAAADDDADAGPPGACFAMSSAISSLS